MRGDKLGDMRFECTKLKEFPMEIPKVVLTLLVGCMVVVAWVLVYVAIEVRVVEGWIEFLPWHWVWP